MKIKVQTNCYIDSELKQIAQERKISLSEVLEFGIKFKLAEADMIDYPKNKLSEKIIKLVNQLEEQCQTKDKETQ